MNCAPCPIDTATVQLPPVLTALAEGIAALGTLRAILALRYSVTPPNS